MFWHVHTFIWLASHLFWCVCSKWVLLTLAQVLGCGNVFIGHRSCTIHRPLFIVIIIITHSLTCVQQMSAVHSGSGVTLWKCFHPAQILHHSWALVHNHDYRYACFDVCAANECASDADLWLGVCCLPAGICEYFLPFSCFLYWGHRTMHWPLFAQAQWLVDTQCKTRT